jgi:hypothetical protein
LLQRQPVDFPKNNYLFFARVSLETTTTFESSCDFSTADVLAEASLVNTSLVTKSPSWTLHLEENKNYKAKKINTEKRKTMAKNIKLTKSDSY